MSTTDTSDHQRWKTPLLIAGGIVGTLLVIRVAMAIVSRLRRETTVRTANIDDMDIHDDDASNETIVMIPTYDRRAPSKVGTIARCAALAFIRAHHPSRVHIRVAYPLALWDADHDVVQTWETTVRSAIVDEYQYRVQARNTAHRRKTTTTTPQPFFLHRNIRFERSRDIWSYGDDEKKRQFRGTGPWWDGARETYTYAVHPMVELARDWDVAGVDALHDAEISAVSAGMRMAVLSPTMVRRERADVDSTLDWRMTFPRMSDRGDSRGVHLRRSPFTLETGVSQPSAVAYYDDVFARTKTICELFDAVAKRVRHAGMRATYADITGAAVAGRILPHCPPRALGQSSRSAFLTDMSVIGSLAQWRTAVCANKRDTGTQRRWIDLRCGVSHAASENEAIAKYGEPHLRHWPAPVVKDAEAIDPPNQKHIQPPAPAPAQTNDETPSPTPFSARFPLIPDRPKTNDDLDCTIRFVPTSARTEGPRPIDVNLERRFENDLVAEALVASTSTGPNFDAPTTASGIERPVTSDCPTSTWMSAVRAAHAGD